jgi:surfeit locus 1 family protein
MLQRWIDARLGWPTAFAVLGLAVLCGLGTWQLQRKAWKEGIVARIEARVTAPPVPLAEIAKRIGPGADIEYTHVTATGRFHHDKERYVYAPGKSGLEWHVLTPLETTLGQIVWVNRGSVPDAKRAPDTRPQGQVAGPVTVTGLLRQPQAATFTPQNDVARNIWHWADIPGLTRSAFPDGDVAALPIVVERDATPVPPGGLPQGGVTRLAIPNRHLEYAVTWYGLALTLVGVFAAFAWKRLREEEGLTV